MPEAVRLLVAGAGVGLLVLLVACWRLHAFVALTLVSLLVGLGAGLEPAATVRAYGDGVGAVLRGIAAVVGLGTILGKLLGESGGAAEIGRASCRERV